MNWKILPIILAALLVALPLAAAQTTATTSILVNVLDEDGSPISGIEVIIANSSGILETVATNSTGWVNVTVQADADFDALIATKGPIAWLGQLIAFNTTNEIHIWLNDTSSWHKVNVTVIIGSEEGTITFNATLKANASNPISVEVSDLQAPVFIYVPASDPVAVAVIALPENVTKNLVTYRLENITITYANGSVAYTNETQISVDASIESIEIKYSPTAPMFLGIPLQTWVVIGLIAILAGILAVVVRVKKAAQAVLRRERRTLRDYELTNNHNGILFHAIEAYNLEDKRRLARRLLRRAD
ncbi:MAG: hypothetical protein DRJ47_10280 [Thermoprotei archaeon]|nr:MAG: hypothetical protein DRJ47_10280 [Thermoprotei archaeon]